MGFQGQQFGIAGAGADDIDNSRGRTCNRHDGYFPNLRTRSGVPCGEQMPPYVGRLNNSQWAARRPPIIETYYKRANPRGNALSQLTPELERKLTTAVERMPAFPKSVQKILELTRNINCLPKELVGVIEKDPVMTMKILKVINSAYYSLPNKITSVNQSVVYLGINTIKNLALSFATVGILPRTNTVGFDIQRYLLHSLATGSVARQLCHAYGNGEADPADCFVAGLLHDFGKVVYAQFMPDEFRRALIISDGDYWGLMRGGASKVFLAALVFLLALQGIAWAMGYRKRMADEAS